MGKKLDKVQSIVREGKEKSMEARRMGEQAIAEVARIAAVADSLPQDADDEVREAYQRMRENTRERAKEYLESVVGERVRDAEGKFSESQTEARAQIEKNREAESGIRRMDGISQIGRDGRERAIADIGRSTEQFEHAEGEAQAESRAAGETLKQQMARIITEI